MITEAVALFDLDSLRVSLTEASIKKTSRRINDAVIVAGYINERILRSNSDGRHYFTISNKEIAQVTPLTESQADSGKRFLSEQGVIEALPKRKNSNGAWVNMWQVTIMPTERLGMLVEVKARKTSKMSVKVLPGISYEDHEKGFARFIGTHFTNAEFANHYSNAEGYWNAENWESPEVRKHMTQVVKDEMEAIIAEADLTELKAEYDSMIAEVDTSELDELMA